MLVAAARHATLLQPARRRLAVQAVNLDAWLEEHGPTLKPPVANKLLFGGDLKVMVVGGPNQRRDYHLQEGEEFFAQLEGALTLKTIERGSFKDVRVTGGDCFLLPSRVPHSPQREAASLPRAPPSSPRSTGADHAARGSQRRDPNAACRPRTARAPAPAARPGEIPAEEVI